MKIIYTLITLLVLLFFVFPANAQMKDQQYPWQLGIGAGYTNYYGDLSNYRIEKLGDITKLYHFASFNHYYIPQPSISVLLQKKFNPALGFMLQFNQLSFAMSDRYRNTDGSIAVTGADFARSLNFKTTLRDAGIALTFSAANGRALKGNSFFYPSFYLGTGVAVFNVSGDLYDYNGNQYNYNQPGNINDGIFETNLRDIQTETANRYSKVSPYLDLGLSLNFRINALLILSLQSDIKYAGTDYLDDVSGRYKTSYPSPAASYAAYPGYNVIDPLTRQRGDLNSVNDMYINNRLVLHINLSKQTAASTFKAPAVYSLASDPYLNRAAVLTAPKQDMSRIATVNSRKMDTLIAVKDTVHLPVNDTAHQRRVEHKLDSIQQQLTDIKTVIRNQAFEKAFQYLHFKQDSLKLLKKALQLKKNLTREDNLNLRIYDLQEDSLRNEIIELQRRAEAGWQVGDTTWRQSHVWQFNATQPIAVFHENKSQLDTMSQFPPMPDSLTDEQVAGLNREIIALIGDSRYEKDSSYHKTIDSLNNKLKDYQNIKARQQLADSVQQVTQQLNGYSLTDTSLHKLDTVNQHEQVDATGSTNRSAVEASPIVEDSVAQQLLAVSQNRLRENNDSIAVLKYMLQQSRDSAAYYRRVTFAANSPVNTTPEKPAKWYRRILPGKKKNEQSTNNGEILKGEEREKYYDQQLMQLNDRLTTMQQRNLSLNNEYGQNRRRRNDRLPAQAAVPVIISAGGNAGGSASELRALRNEINGLRNQLIAQQVLTTTVNRQPVRTDPRDLRDTIYVKAADSVLTKLSAVAADSAHQAPPSPQVVAMQQQIAFLQTEIDKLKTAPVKSAAAPVSNEKLPDVTVYFGMNAAALASEQINKLSIYNRKQAVGTATSFILTGYTDGVGNAASNNALAKKRMMYIKQLLVTQFDVPPSQIKLNEPVINVGSGSKENALQRKVYIEVRQ